MSSGVSGFGCIFHWDGVDLDESTQITGPSESMSPIDVTNHDSASAFREFVAGIHDGGEITVEGNFISGDSTGQIAMHTDFQATTVKAWKIKHPAWVASSHEYPEMDGNGYVTSFEINCPYDGPITYKATIKVTGKPTLTVS